MLDIQKLISDILSDKKLSHIAANNTDKVYRDEPILKTASQMDSFFPAEYRSMRKIAKNIESYFQSDASVFLKQGIFMADFEDNYDYRGEFMSYFPTYQAMNDLQLRGYFTWRTKVRHDDIKETSLSFAFVYIYELLNLIGVSSAEEGYYKLCEFLEIYNKIDLRINRYAKQWISDFVIYNNLDPSLLEGFADLEFDNALLVLLDYSSHNTVEFFSALNLLSSYNLENSKFFKEYPEDVMQVVCAVFKDMSEYFVKSRKYSYAEKLFGKKCSRTCYLFYSAVFYDRKKYTDYTYEINSIDKYRCRNGNWSCEKYHGYSGCCRELGDMLKAVDSIMRRKYKYKYNLKPVKITKTLQSFIDKEAEIIIAMKIKAQKPEINIDISKLGKIREASVSTRDKLIVIEETEYNDTAVISAPEPALHKNDTALNDIEYELMSCLLYGKEYQTMLKSHGAMLSVLIDSVNEKLFDTFGDTVIVFDSNSPHVLDDYADELKGMIIK